MPSDYLIDLWVPGEPVPKGRPRFAGGRAYTPARTLEAERCLRDAVLAVYPRTKPTTGPYELRVDFYIQHRRRRDVDNLAKLVMDALNNVVWADDTQVNHLTALLHKAGTHSGVPNEAGTRLRIKRRTVNPWA